LKLLLDENLSRRLVPLLLPHYPESTHVCLVGLERAADAEIRAYAAQHGHVIVTRDSDFNDMAVLRGAPPQVIRLRITNCRNDDVAQLLIMRQDDLRARLKDPAIALVEVT
jgi:predicted nuclease of predicted toxin-antitoxin system